MNQQPQSRCSPLRTARAWRKGMTVIVVLGVISITLALSYAMLRSQVTAVEIQSNLDRANSSRQAAYAGISAALRALHNNSWGGVDSSLSQDLSDHQWYEVSYETGDPTLTGSDPEFAEFPFRVTVHSIGYAEDPSQPEVRASYRVRVVVELVRKQLNSEPTAWSSLRSNKFTTYQWGGSGLPVEFPVRVEGPMYVQGALTLAYDYPIDPLSRTRYLDDLTRMKNAGEGDFRPLTGPIFTPFVKQLSATLTLLGTSQQITLQDIPTATSAPVTYPNMITSYQLYPGGKSYNMPNLQAIYGPTLSNLTLDSDPIANPLGVFLGQGCLTLADNVTVNGTILTWGVEPDIRIKGVNVALQAKTLPKLADSEVAYQLPAAIVKDDFHVYSGADCKVRGAVLAWDDFSFLLGDAGTKCDFQGRAVANRMNFLGRPTWDLSMLTWQNDLVAFNLQKDSSSGTSYFPKFLKSRRGMNYEPLLTVKPAAAEIVHYWHNFSQPLYVAHPDDPGLQWNLIDWADNPKTKVTVAEAVAALTNN
jgi:hypothetical protein